MHFVSDVLSGSTTLTGTFSTSGSIRVAGGELLLTNATVESSGLVIDQGAIVSPLDVAAPGFASSAVNVSTIETDVVNRGTLAFSSGNAADRFMIDGSVSGKGSIDLFQTAPIASGEMIITGAVSKGQSVIFEPENYLGSGYPERLVLDNGSSFAGTVSGFSEAPGRAFGQYVGDEITLVNVAGTSVTGSRYVGDANGGVLTLTDGKAAVDKVAFTGDYTLANFAVSSSGATTTVTAAPCFAAGTRLQTTEGERAVETLRPGQVVVLASGETAPIVWVGHRRVCKADPVRVVAGAFGSGLPTRDLVLSPEHALFLDGHLIPVHALVDGRSVLQEAWERVTYHHVELDRHGVLLAEGLPAESYLDTGNRASFANGTLVSLRAKFGRGDETAETCAPLALSGMVVETQKKRLQTIASERKHTAA